MTSDAMSEDEFEGGWIDTHRLYCNRSGELHADRFVSGYTSYAWIRCVDDGEGTTQFETVDMVDDPRYFTDRVPGAAIKAATADFLARQGGGA